MSQVVRMLVGNVKTFSNPRIINTVRHFSSARKFSIICLKINFVENFQMNARYHKND